MADIATMRNGIQTRLATITGLRSYDVQTGQEIGPCAIVFPSPPSSGWHQTTNGSCGSAFEFIVEVHVPLKIGMAKAQDTLDGYINPTGTKSLAAAIAGDPTLGGAAKTAIARAFTLYAFSELNKVATLMAMVPIEVTA